MSDNIIVQDAAEGYVSEMARYSIADNLNRMFPQAKDGLKPVQRRLLYDMLSLGALSLSSKKKSARVTGDTMGKFHPHANAYGSIATIEQWWKCKEPLVTGYGNWGNFQGDGPAADRYTELYLSQFALDAGLGMMSKHEEVVDWMKNYTGEFWEPEYIPFMAPVLLINGASGVGVGMSMDLPTHNLHEVMQEAIALLHDPNHEVVLVPDFCMPCEIIDTDWKTISNTGYGSFRARGIIETGEYKGKPALFIRSLPNGVYSNDVREKLESLQEKGVINQINNILWEGSEKDMNLVVQLKPGSDPNYMKDMIYKYTNAESPFRIDFEVIDEITPVRFSYKSYLEYFNKMSKLTILRMYCAMEQEAKTRWHQLDAYIKVIESGEVDTIINFIRKSTSDERQKLIDWITKKIDVTDLQAAFIIDTRLAKLSKGALNSYKDEAARLLEQMKQYENIILNDDAISAEVEKYYIEIDRKYSKPRLCKVIKASDITDIPKGVFTIAITENGMVRKLPENSNVGAVKGDYPSHVIKAENDQNIIIFSRMGKAFKLPVHKIPLTDKGSIGTDVRILCKGMTSDVANVMYEPMIQKVCSMKHKHYMVVTTACNYIKKLDLEDFLSVTPSGTTYTKLANNDVVVDVSILPEGADMVIYSGNNALRINSNEVPHYKRNSIGVLAMNTKDCISGASVLYSNEDNIIVVTKNGKVNRLSAVGLERAKRNGKGKKVMKLSSTDSIVSIRTASDKDVLRIISANNIMDIPVTDIQLGSTLSAGTPVLSGKGDSVIKVELI